MHKARHAQGALCEMRVGAWHAAPLVVLPTLHCKCRPHSRIAQTTPLYTKPPASPPPVPPPRYAQRARTHPTSHEHPALVCTFPPSYSTLIDKLLLDLPMNMAKELGVLHGCLRAILRQHAEEAGL